MATVGSEDTVGSLDADYGATSSTLHEHAMTLPLLVIAVATLAFLAPGVDVRLCQPFLVLFPVAAGACLARNRRRSSHSFGTDARPILAAALAFAATWLGLAVNSECFSSTHPQHYEAWRQLHGATSHYYPTDIVCGFPLQAVEGHTGGGAPEFLPAGKGLGALLANFGLLLAACSVAAYFVPRRVAIHSAWAAVIAAPLCGLLGYGVLRTILD